MTVTQHAYQRETRKALETVEEVREHLLTKAALGRFERRVAALIRERRSFMRD